MKKSILLACLLILSSSAVFAEGLKSRVYIGANLSQCFENFSYDEYVNSIGKENSSDKTLYGPRYDFVAGFRLTENIRIEGQYLIVSQNSFNTDKADSKIEYKASAVFANAVIDFWNMDNHLITPFIGVGAGVGSTNLTLNYNALKKEADENGFSWQLQGGATLKLLNWLYVNIKYTYLSLPDAEKSIEANSDYVKSELKKGVQAVGVGVMLLL